MSKDKNPKEEPEFEPEKQADDAFEVPAQDVVHEPEYMEDETPSLPDSPDIETTMDLMTNGNNNSQLTAPSTLDEGLARMDMFKNLEEQRAFAQVLVNSKLVPAGLNTADKVIVAMNMGRELRVKPVTAINNIHVVNGKPGLSVHLVGTLIRAKGVTYRLVKDGIKDMVTEPDKDGKLVERRDVVTTIEFSIPKFNIVTRQWEIDKQEMTFTWNDAIMAGYAVKDTWKGMPRVMMRNRCLVIGARFFIPEALNGLYEVTELLDTDNIKYSVDEHGMVKNIG